MPAVSAGQITIVDVNDGVDGLAGPALQIIASAGGFTFQDGVATPADQTIALTLLRQGLDATAANWAASGATLATNQGRVDVAAYLFGLPGAGDGDTAYLTLAQFGAARQMAIGATVGSLAAYANLVRIGDTTAEAGATRNVLSGAWATATAYAVGDIVVRDGFRWICLLAHVSSGSILPPVYPATANTYWRLEAGREALTTSRSITGSSWADAEAATAIANAGGVSPVQGDLVTLYNSAAGYSETRIRSSAGPWTALSVIFGGNVIVDNTLTASKIQAGAVTAAKIAAGAISTDKLVVTGRGAALNDDPGFLDPSAWTAFYGTPPVYAAVTDGVAGNGVARSPAAGTESRINVAVARRIPFDPNKSYRLRGWARTASGSGSTFFMGLALFDAAGNNLAGAGTQWSYAAASNSTVPATWTAYKAAYGAGTPNPFPANARTMSPVVILSYGGGTAIHEVQDLRIEEMAGGDLIVDGAITTAKIAAGAVTANEIASNTITAGKIAAGAIGADQIAANAVTAAKIEAGAVTTGKLLVTGRGAALNDDPAVSDPSAWVLHSGTAPTIQEVSDPAAGRTTLRASGGTWVASRTFAVDVNKRYRLRCWARGDGSATGSFWLRTQWFDAAGATITYTNTAPVTTHTAAWVRRDSGDVVPPAGAVAARVMLIFNYGASVGYHEVQDVRFEEAIGADLIVDGAITAAKISAGAVTTGKLAAGAVTADTISANAVTSAKIEAGAIVAGKIAGGAIQAADIAAGAVTTGKLAAGAVTANEIAANAITTGKVAAGAITADQIAAGSLRAQHVVVVAKSLNPDSTFSAGTARWSTLVQRLAASNAAVPSGCPAQFAAQFGSRDNMWSFDDLDVQPGERYRVSIWVNRSATTYPAGWVSYSFSSTGADLQTYPAGSTSASGWQRVTTEFEVPANCVRMRFGAWINGPQGSTGTAWFADFHIEKMADASLIVDGAVTAVKVAAGAITTAKLAAGAVTANELSANAVVAGKIAAGAVNAGQIAAGAITTDKLLVTGRGAALNDDPGCQDPSAWQNGGHGDTASQVTVNDGIAGSYAFRSTTGTASSIDTAKLHPVSSGKRYRLSAWVRRSATANGVLYLRLVDQLGNQLTQFYEATSPSTTWVRLAAEFAPTTAQTAVRIRLILNWTGSAGYHEATDIRLEEKAEGDLIVDGGIVAARIAGGTITADKMVTGLLSADNVLTRGLTVRDNSGNVLFGVSTNLDFSRVGGATRPQDNATVGAVAGANLRDSNGRTVSDVRLLGNLLDATTWVPDSSGTQVGFSQNAPSAGGLNSIAYDSLPDGSRGVLWRARSGSAAGSSAEGGWNSTSFNVVSTKMYRFSVWIRCFGANASGSFYLGVGGGTVSDIGGGINYNPYFLANGRSLLPDSQWVLVVGYVYPSSYGGTQYNRGGVYRGSDGVKILDGTDFKWVAGTTSSYHRTYQYYTNQANNYQDFWNPRVDLVDGTEPSLDSLLAGGKAYAASQTATWGGVSSRPSNLASLSGGEAIQNSQISISGGAIQGIGSGAGTAVANANISIGSNGALSGAGGGQVTLGGIGFSGDTDAQRNSRITVDGSGLLQGIGSGAGTAVANSVLPSGVNLQYNADFTNGLDGWTSAGGYGIGSQTEGGINLNTSWYLAPYSGPGTGVLWSRQAGRAGSDGYYYEIEGRACTVVGGKRYAISAYTGAHRCKVAVFAYVYDASNNAIANTYVGNVENNEEASGGSNLTGYKRTVGVATLPSNAAYVKVRLRKYDTKSGYSDSYMFVGRVQVEQVADAANDAGAWSPMGYLADDSIGIAKFGTDIQTTNYAANSAGWRITKAGQAFFNDISVRGRIAGGSFTAYAWPGYGQGGFYLGPEGLLLGNANGNTVGVGQYFQIDAGTGNVYSPQFTIINGSASFSGTLSAAIVNTDQIVGNAASTPYTTTSAGASASITVVVPNNASALLIQYYLGPDTYTYTGGGGKGDPGGYVQGPVLTGLTYDGSTTNVIVVGPTAGSHTVTVTRSYYTGTMRLSVLVLKR